MPDVFMIGGANGSGKTTAALTVLPRYLDIFEFVNADEIARGLNPLKPDTADMAAGRVMIERIRSLMAGGKNFAFETTCSGTHHVQTLKDCREAGYKLNLIYLWLPSADMAVQRVMARVRQGGHAVPEETIRRRYTSGLTNAFAVYLPLVDMALFLDNSDITPKQWKVIAEKKAGPNLQVYIPAIWKDIMATAERRNS